MPNGIIVIKWDRESGLTLESMYPKSLKFPKSLFKQIYSTYWLLKRRSPEYSSLTMRKGKVISFFSGTEEDYVEVENYVVAILLRKDESIFDYQEHLKIIASKILKNIGNENLNEIMKESFYRFSSKVPILD